MSIFKKLFFSNNNKLIFRGSILAGTILLTVSSQEAFAKEKPYSD